MPTKDEWNRKLYKVSTGEKTQADVAREFDISRSAVSQRYNNWLQEWTEKLETKKDRLTTEISGEEDQLSNLREKKKQVLSFLPEGVTLGEALEAVRKYEEARDNYGWYQNKNPELKKRKGKLSKLVEQKSEELKRKRDQVEDQDELLATLRKECNEYSELLAWLREKCEQSTRELAAHPNLDHLIEAKFQQEVRNMEKEMEKELESKIKELSLPSNPPN